MTSDKVAKVLSIYEGFNRRDLDMALEHLGPHLSFVDRMRGQIVTTPTEVKERAAAWLHAFSDARISEIRTIDGDDGVVVQFVAEGTHDGPLGPLPATGRRMRLDFCDVYRFDDEGRIVANEPYYDRLELLIQLGLVPPVQVEPSDVAAEE